MDVICELHVKNLQSVKSNMKTSEKILRLLESCQSRRQSTEAQISDKALDTFHHARNISKATCYWLGFLRGIISSDGINEYELEPLILHTEDFLKQFDDEDAAELLQEMCNAWPDLSEEVEGLVENILEYREHEAINNLGYNPNNYFNGYLKGIACDNRITTSELSLALKLIKELPALSEDPRVNQLSEKINEFLFDGVIDDDESDELCDWISRIVGDSFSDTGVTTPYDLAGSSDYLSHFEEGDISGSTIAVTGVFEGPFTRRYIINALESRGAHISKSVSGKVDYLIVASEASKHWATTNAGTKLLKAHSLRAKTGKPELVHEYLINALLE